MNPSDFDRIKGSLVAFVRQLLAPTDLHALYRSTVKAQNEDGTLELKPDTDRFGPGLSKVPIRSLPGVVPKLKKDARVLLAFEDGDQRRPIAVLGEESGLVELVITASVKVTVAAPSVVLARVEGDARPVAVVGSIVEVAFVAPPGVPAGIPLQGVGYVTDGVAAVLAGG
jgi:hypothetical protein